MKSYLDELLASLNPNPAPDFRMQGVEDVIPQQPAIQQQPIQLPKAPMPAPMPEENQAAPQPIDPVVKEAIMRKFNLGQYSDENRQKLVDDNNAYDLAGNTGGALASLAAAFQGGNSVQAANSVLDRNALSRRNSVIDFDKGRDEVVKNHKQGRETDLQNREDDLTSDESKLAQSLAKKMVPSVDVSQMTATQINQKLPSLQKIYEIEQKKLDRAEARSAASSSNNLSNFAAKEGIKEDVRINTENRKERKQLDKDLQTWDALEKQIDEATALATAYNKGFGPGSGIAGKARSFLGPLAPETQDLDTALQKLSMDQMVKQFAGMSKAIDTPAERAQFDKTVPSLSMDNSLLLKELKNRKDAAMSAKNRIREAQGQYDRSGRFLAEPTSSEPTKNSYPKQVRKGTQIATVSNAQEEKEANDEGFN